MHRRTIALLLLLASPGIACGTAHEAESGGVSPGLSSITGTVDESGSAGRSAAGPEAG